MTANVRSDVERHSPRDLRVAAASGAVGGVVGTLC